MSVLVVPVLFCHSRGLLSGNPERTQRKDWIPVFTGMAKWGTRMTIEGYFQVRMKSEKKEKPKKPIKTERRISSGGVVFRKSNKGIEVALIEVESSKGKVWSLPKGLKEQDENLAKTAHREVREETGLDGRIIGKIDDIHYFYSEKNPEGTKRFFKIVYFFLMAYTGGDVVNHDKEVVDCKWFPIDEAIEIIAYKDEQEILEKAREIIGDAG